MNKKVLFRLLGGTTLLVAAAISLGLTRTPAARERGRRLTLSSLQSAYNDETNAQNRYLAFAQRAEQDGFGEVASLFRAAALAEQVHASNHAAVIRKLGASPEAIVTTPDVASTRENLEESVADEADERDRVYPEKIAQARSVNLTDAVRTFTLARTAEHTHATLLREALTNLENHTAPGRTYSVCRECGYTASALDFAKCPSCLSAITKFVSVS